MKWTLAHIEKLKAEGKIRDYTIMKKKNDNNISEICEGKIVSKLFKKKSKQKEWIEAQLFYWAQEKGYNLKSEFHFHKTRKYRFDWCIEELMLAVEFEGGIFDRNGSHTSVKGMQRDIYKYNEAASLGWKVLRFSAINYKDLLTELNKIQ